MDNVHRFFRPAVHSSIESNWGNTCNTRAYSFFNIYVPPLSSLLIGSVPTPIVRLYYAWHNKFSAGNKSRYNVSRYGVLNKLRGRIVFSPEFAIWSILDALWHCTVYSK